MPEAGERAAAAVPTEVEHELAVLTRRLDIDVPDDLAGGVLRGYQGLRKMAALLRRFDSAEPAGGVGPEVSSDA